MEFETVRSEADRLIDLGLMLNPEGEPLDLTDVEYTPKQMAELRSLLSSMRKSIDTVNNALARAWDTDHQGESYTDDVNRHWVGRAKKKEFIKDSGFYDWLATKTADELVSLVNPTTIKVTGLTDTERSTFFDESKRTDRLSIQSMPVALNG